MALIQGVAIPVTNHGAGCSPSLRRPVKAWTGPQSDRMKMDQLIGHLDEMSVAVSGLSTRIASRDRYALSTNTSTGTPSSRLARPCQPRATPPERHRCIRKEAVRVGPRPAAQKQVRTGSGKPRKASKRALSAHIKLLQTQVKQRRELIKMLTNRTRLLNEENDKLQQEIMDVETNSHRHVERRLVEYDHQQRAVHTVEICSAIQLKEERDKTEMMKKKMDKDIKVTEMEVLKVERKLKEARERLNDLYVFKDNDYPRTALHVAELGRELDIVSSNNELALKDLRSLMEAELQRNDEAAKTTWQEMRESAIQSAVGNTPSEVTKMALENRTLEKEVEMFREEIQSTQEAIEHYETNIAACRSSFKEVRYKCYPAAKPIGRECQPNDDIVLTINRRPPLPF